MKEKRITRVVVADEWELLCEGIAAICERDSPFRVVAHCSDGLSALRMLESLRPDIALLQLNLPKLFGLAVIDKAVRASVPSRLILMSEKTDRKTVIAALRHGANGFLAKSDCAARVLDAFHSVLRGGVYVSPQVTLGEIFIPRKCSSTTAPFETLSLREHQVFSLLVEGMRAKEIAARLDVSPKTVDTFRRSLMRKLDIYDLAGLVKFAVRKNLTSVS
jgi:DNA-binding NarL/FixJ family response regulator